MNFLATWGAAIFAHVIFLGTSLMDGVTIISGFIGWAFLRRIAPDGPSSFITAIACAFLTAAVIDLLSAYNLFRDASLTPSGALVEAISRGGWIALTVLGVAASIAGSIIRRKRPDAKSEAVNQKPDETHAPDASNVETDLESERRAHLDEKLEQAAANPKLSAEKRAEAKRLMEDRRSSAIL